MDYKTILFTMNVIQPIIFNPRNSRNDPQIVELFNSFSEEFRSSEGAEYMYIGNRWFAMTHIDREGESWLYSLNAKEPNTVYKFATSIWNNVKEDSWYKLSFMFHSDSIYIILSDYDGFYLLDLCLEIIYRRAVTDKMIASNDVYGYYTNGMQLDVWPMSEMIGAPSPYIDEYHDVSRSPTQTLMKFQV